MDSSVGLRERKKEATRQAVHEATLRLTVEHGFDRVTVEAVADAAGISRRTFSNYFTNKEDALLYGEEEHIRALVQEVRNRPAEEDAWPALRAAVAEFSQRMAPPEREWAVRTRLAMRHPSLLARQLANHAALERDLAGRWPPAGGGRGGRTPPGPGRGVPVVAADRDAAVDRGGRGAGSGRGDRRDPRRDGPRLRLRAAARVRVFLRGT